MNNRRTLPKDASSRFCLQVCTKADYNGYNFINSLKVFENHFKEILEDFEIIFIIFWKVLLIVALYHTTKQFNFSDLIQ